MPRRTKLIIATLFLVLLAIPLAYIILTWHPANPLRFRIDNRQTVDFEKIEEGDFLLPLYVTVENVSDAPVLLMLGSASMPGHSATSDQDVGYLTPELAYETTPQVKNGSWRLPPRSTTRCCMIVDSVAEARALMSGKSVIDYSWISSVKYRFVEGSNWVHDHTPDMVHRLIPELLPGEDRTAIDPAPSPSTPAP